jgi:hypothetical protein
LVIDEAITELGHCLPAFVVIADRGADHQPGCSLLRLAGPNDRPRPSHRPCDIVGEFTNKQLTDVVAIVGTAIILVLNVVLLLQTFGVNIPGLPSS